MYNITIICTRHEEIGKCNSQELCKLIEEFKPEVIFEELSPAAYNRCYILQDLIKLESTAIKTYLQNRNVKHIPVVGQEMHSDHHAMHKRMERNPNWCRLIANLEYLEGIYGFPFLNSNQCERLFEGIKVLEMSALLDNDDEMLSRIYHRANRAVENYENEIIANVHRYSIDNKYDEALMFIGAAHRQSIMQKVEQYEKFSKVKLNWTLYNKGN